jgi:nitroreductase
LSDGHHGFSHDPYEDNGLIEATPANSSDDRSAPGCVATRRSVPARQLGPPGPDQEAVERMLRSAVRVPDHGKRVPFRFLRIAGRSRDALGDLLVARTLQRDPDASPAILEKERMRFSHAPLVIGVVAVLGPDDKIPESERFSCASCVCFALLQAAQAQGFGAQWLTGWPAYDPQVLGVLELAGHERIAGFVHIGTPRMQAPERERPDPATLLTDLALDDPGR